MSHRKRKRIYLKLKNMKVKLLVQAVSITTEPGTDVQTVNLQLRYEGEEVLAGQINQDEELTIEIPSTSPPGLTKEKKDK
jgi:hypothetical protein